MSSSMWVYIEEIGELILFAGLPMTTAVGALWFLFRKRSPLTFLLIVTIFTIATGFVITGKGDPNAPTDLGFVAFILIALPIAFLFSAVSLAIFWHSNKRKTPGD